MHSMPSQNALDVDGEQFELGAVLHQGRRSLLQLATHRQDAKRLVFKAIAPGVTERRARQRMRHENEMLRLARGPGVVPVHGLTTTALGLTLALGEVPGATLESLLQGPPQDLPTFLELAQAMVTAVEALHARGVAHLDLNPQHILLEPVTWRTTLVDLSRASQLPLPPAEPLGRTLEELAWLAPEQTGRLDRLADSRTDLYALGAIFYRMLTQRMPVWAEDPLALVHAIVAHPPAPVATLRPDLPEVLCHIVDRLLRKSADDRYQSAAGLRADLQTCRQTLTSEGQIPPFQIGLADRSERLALPSGLYGRDRDIAALIDAVELVRTGQKPAVAVLGPAGIGKTSIVHQLRPWARERGGLFGAGKFDQLLRTEAYGPLRVALDPVIRQILAQRSGQVEAWRTRLAQAVDAGADAVVALLPALGALLPETQVARGLSSIEQQARQRAAMSDLLRALHHPDAPFVLFLDDMQWADTATLDLVEAILRAPDPRNPILVLAWRDDEVPPGHPLHSLLNRLGEGGPVRLALAPLQTADVSAMLADALILPEPRVRPLAQRVTERAEGNPFTVKEILVALHEAQALVFEREIGEWTWHLDAVDRLVPKDGVVELLSRRIRALPPEASRLLAEVACFGQDVDLGLLAIALHRPPGELVRDAAFLGHKGLLVPAGEGWELAAGWSAEPQSGDTPQRLVVRFPHDRVQEAARTTLPVEERVALHLDFARRMWRAGVAERDDRGLYLVAEQLMRGLPALQTDPERADAVERLTRASRRARTAAAFGPALAFAEAALSILDTHKQLDGIGKGTHFELHLAAAEAAVTLADRARADRHVEAGEPLAPDALARVALERVRIRGHLARGEHEAAVDRTWKSLKNLGFDGPRHPKPLHLAGAFARITWRMWGANRTTLNALPLCEDPRVAAGLGLMSEALLAAFLCEPNLTSLWTLELLDLTMRHGLTPHGSYAIACYGFLRAALFQDLKGGADYMLAARDAVQRLEATEYLAKVEVMDVGFVQYRLRPMRELVATWQRIARHGIEGGDTTFAAQSINNAVSYALVCGVDVDELERMANSAIALCRRVGQDRSVLWLKFFHQMIDNLRGRAADPLVLRGDYVDGEAWLAEQLSGGDNGAVTPYHFHATQLRVWLGAAATALPHLLPGEKGFPNQPGTQYVPLMTAYGALVRIAAAREELEKSEHLAARKLVKHAQKNLKTLEKWLKPSPVNFLQLRDLIRAELADVAEHHDEAAGLYETAIASARAADHGQETALALELAGMAWLRRGMGRTAASYFVDARAAWLQHGVSARVERFDSLLHRAQQLGASSAPLPVAETGAGNPALGLDATAIARAARALSGEIRVDALLEQLLRLAVQTAGATRGALLLVRDGVPTVAAEAEDGPGGLEVRSLTADPEEILGPLASVTAYVQRTGESVVLEDASADPRFAEAYANRGGGAVLAAPLVRATELVGVIALEHRHVSRAFTAERLEMVETLAAQAAVSLVNAQLYESLNASLENQRRLTHAYQRFVPQEFVTQLGKKSILDVKLGDQVQEEVTALFADIRGFTRVAERLGPKETFAFVNRYLAQMEPAIYGHGGHISQFMGDGIMAVFPRSADDAVQGALAMFVALEEFNELRKKDGLDPVKIGIGINTGAVMVGAIGGRSRMDRGLIGDPVNVASRVEGLCKGYGASLLLGGDTHSRLTDAGRYRMRILDRVVASGKESAIDVYEVLDAESPARQADKLAGRPHYERGVSLWQARKPAEARAAFEQALVHCPDDEAAMLFMERCKDAELRGTPLRADGASRLSWK